MALGRSALEARFVGRSQELQALLAVFDATRSEGRPRFVLLEGAAGIGKSRLLQEFLAAARSSAPSGAVLQGRCPATGRGLTNWALAEILRRACGIGLDDPPDVVRERLRGGVERVLAPLSLAPSATDEIVHGLATSASIVLPGNPFDRLEPRLVPAVVLRAWSTFLGAHARQGGAVLAIEDLHWAGSGVLDVLSGIAPELDGGLLVVATARPGFREANPAFLADHEVRWIDMPPLSDDETRELIRRLLSEASIPEDVRAAIVARAEGNPYFVEELLQHMVRSGSLTWDGLEWRMPSPGRSVVVPDSLPWVLGARVGSLPIAERRVLQEAAVVGRVFWEGPIRRGLADADLVRHLDSLAARGLVSARPSSSLSGQTEFAFKHALLRDAAYDTMSSVHRARSHAAVGGWLAELAGERPDELGELIAEHFRLAIESDTTDQAWATERAERETIRGDAFRHLLAAGRAAHHRFALEKAVELHEAALRLATSDGEQATVLTAIGQDHESALRGPEALDAYNRAIEAAARGRLPDGERAKINLGVARLLTLRWGAFPARPDPEGIDAVVDDGLSRADDPETRCWLLAFRGGAGVRWRATGRPDPMPLDERLRATAAAMDGAHRLGLADLSATAGRLQAQLEFFDGRYVDAQTTMRTVALVIDAIESPFLRALTSAYVTLSISDIEGAYADALVQARRSLEFGRDLSPHEHMHGTFMTLWCLYHLGAWAEIPALVEEHVEALQGQDAFICPYMRGGPLIGALAFSHLGEFDEARRLAALVQESDKDPGLPEALMARVQVAIGAPGEGVTIARRLLASGRQPSLEENEHESVALVEALLALEDWDGLRGFLPEARRRSGALAILEPICDRAEAMAAAAAGDADRASTLLRSACGWFERHEVPYELARTKTLLAGILPDGSDMLAEAIATVEPLLRGRAPAVPPPPPSAEASLSGLTDREVEVLRLVAAGRSNAEIGAALFLSLRTVERHLSNAYLKLGLSGRTARVAAAAALARLEPPSARPPA